MEDLLRRWNVWDPEALLELKGDTCEPLWVASFTLQLLEYIQVVLIEDRSSIAVIWCFGRFRSRSK